MQTPSIFIAYAPRAGLRCALAYLAAGRDVYGWYTGLAEGHLESTYFVLENYYSRGELRFVAVAEEDLHSGWTTDEARCHELAQLQDAFLHEWLVYSAQPGAAAQLDQYARAELAAGSIMVRFERLNRFSKLQPNWTYYSPNFEHGVLRVLAKRWPLDYSGSTISPQAA